MKPHHFSSQTHDLESCPLREENRHLKLKIEEIQNTMATENTDLGMENHKLKDRIKELEKRNEFYKKENESLEHDLTELNENVQTLVKKVKELEASQHKWISVEERLPTKEDADVDGDVLASNRLYPRGLFCHYEDINRLGITHWLSNLQPPTTEKSSSVEEG